MAARVRVLAILLLAAALPGEARAAGGAVEGRVTLRKDGAPRPDRSDVVVYLEGAPAPPAPRPPAEHRIVQRDRQFHPRVTVVQKGDTVAFPNQDLIVHNVFSRSAAAEFDLGEYKLGVSRSAQFRKVGTVDVYCNKHPWMVAHVKVLQTPYFAVTGPTGEFRLEDLPPGAYTVVAWHPNADEVRVRVTVAPGQAATVPTLVLVEKARLPHLNKYAAPYDEYR